MLKNNPRKQREETSSNFDMKLTLREILKEQYSWM
jgi:hypothetical protein